MINDPYGEWKAAYTRLRDTPSAEAHAAAMAVTTAQYLQGYINQITHQGDVRSIDAMYEKDPT